MHQVVRILGERTKLHAELKAAEQAGDHLAVQKLGSQLYHTMADSPRKKIEKVLAGHNVAGSQGGASSCCTSPALSPTSPKSGGLVKRAAKEGQKESDQRSIFDEDAEAGDDSDESSDEEGEGIEGLGDPKTKLESAIRKASIVGGQNGRPTGAVLAARGERCDIDDHDEAAPNEMQQLAQLLKAVRFFRDRDITNDCDLVEIAKSLLLETFQKDDMIFDYGDEGDKFYIVVQGSVSIRIPILVPVPAEEQDRRKKQHQHLSTNLSVIRARLATLTVRKERFEKFQRRFGYGDLKLGSQDSAGSASEEGGRVSGQEARGSVFDLQQTMNRTAAILEMPLGLAKVELGKMFRNPVKEVVDYSVMQRGKHTMKNGISSTIIGSLRMHKRGRSLAPKATLATARFASIRASSNNQSRHFGGVESAGLRSLSICSPTRQSIVQSRVSIRSPAQAKSPAATNHKSTASRGGPSSLEHGNDSESSAASEDDDVVDELQIKLQRTTNPDFEDILEEEAALHVLTAKAGVPELDALFAKIAQKRHDIILGIQMLNGEADELEDAIQSINLKNKDQKFKEVATRGLGDSFGELALLSKQGSKHQYGVRAARVVAGNHVHLGVLSEEDYNRCLSKIEKHRQEQDIQFVRNIPYFSTLTRAALLRIVKSFTNIKCSRGQEITTETLKSQVYQANKGEYETATINFNPSPSKTASGAKPTTLNQDNNNTNTHEEPQEQAPLQPEDAIYFVLSGEFVAVQTLMIENKAQPESVHENKKNKDFINLQIESDFIRKQTPVCNVVDTKPKKEEYQQPAQSLMGYRSILCSDKLKQVTNKSSLLKKLPTEKLEFDLVRFGKGQLFGEIQHVISRSLTHDPFIQKVIAYSDLDRRNNLPIAIKCVSLQGGQLLRISAMEFYKKIMSIAKVGAQIIHNVKEKINSYQLNTCLIFEQMKDFNQQNRAAKLRDEILKCQAKAKRTDDDGKQEPKIMDVAVDLKDIILNKTNEKRAAYREIVRDYPDTKKSVNIQSPEPPTEDYLLDATAVSRNPSLLNKKGDGLSFTNQPHAQKALQYPQPIKASQPASPKDLKQQALNKFSAMTQINFTNSKDRQVYESSSLSQAYQREKSRGRSQNQGRSLQATIDQDQQSTATMNSLQAEAVTARPVTQGNQLRIKKFTQQDEANIRNARIKQIRFTQFNKSRQPLARLNEQISLYRYAMNHSTTNNGCHDYNQSTYESCSKQKLDESNNDSQASMRRQMQSQAQHKRGYSVNAGGRMATAPSQTHSHTPAATPGPKIECGLTPTRDQLEAQKQNDAMSATQTSKISEDAWGSYSTSIRQRNQTSLNARSGFKADISRISSFQSHQPGRRLDLKMIQFYQRRREKQRSIAPPESRKLPPDLFETDKDKGPFLPTAATLHRRFNNHIHYNTSQTPQKPAKLRKLTDYN